MSAMSKAELALPPVKMNFAKGFNAGFTFYSPEEKKIPAPPGKFAQMEI